jgi:DnaJ-domain-containing protein 1
MKLDSKFFDRLRVKPDENRLLRDACPLCDWQGCREAGLYPAPKGRGHEGEYHRYCLEHVRQYNKAYNYFAGVPDEEVAQHQKDDVVGHRPTWFVGVNPWARNRAAKSGQKRNGFGFRFGTDDPFGLFGAKPANGTTPPGEPARPIRKAERKCLRQLNLEDHATKAEIKARFKDLVKRHHPDRNGGDRRSEDKLREVIQAYNYLRQAGLA